jgi:hypothetical protein
VPDIEPELITIVEGPTPEFQPSPYLWFQSLLEGPEDAETMMCELRTLNGASILDRCLDAWREGRPVRLDYPDAITLRRQSDVVAMRLMEVDAGPLLVLWVRKPFSELQEEEYDDGEDDVSL